MATYTDSSFTISGSSFTNNSAGGGGGGAFGTYESSFNITSGTFTHNNAGGGAVTSDSSFSIISSDFFKQQYLEVVSWSHMVPHFILLTIL